MDAAWACTGRSGSEWQHIGGSGAVHAAAGSALRKHCIPRDELAARAKAGHTAGHAKRALAASTLANEARHALAAAAAGALDAARQARRGSEVAPCLVAEAAVRPQSRWIYMYMCMYML
jgi:hypothetical protein